MLSFIWGKELIDKIVELVKDTPMSMEAALFNLSFVGVQGLPARVFAKKYFNLLPDENDN